MGYDTQPLLTLKEKEIFFNEAIEKKYILFLEHDVENEACTLKKINGKVVVDKMGKLHDLLS